MIYCVLIGTALAVSAIGFVKYIWFFSVGYGFAIAGIGVALMVMFRNSLTCGTLALCILLVLYGVRLGGFLAMRELKSRTYAKFMKGEIKKSSDVPMFVKFAIWISCVLLYYAETSPVTFRLVNGAETDTVCFVGAAVMLSGLIVETAADVQKSRWKKQYPDKFCSKGLFRVVRCPNYLGELIFWTGTLVSGLTVLDSVFQWICVCLGYIGIVYVMFSGARRLELRQNRNYGEDAEYQEYVHRVPILLPFVPLYSVVKYRFLVA